MKSTISRRDFLRYVATVTGGAVAVSAMSPMLAGCVAPVAAPGAAPAAAAPDAAAGVLLGTVIRTLQNEYHASWFKGGQMFADTVGPSENHRGLHCEGDSELQLTLMQALIQEGGENVIFNIDPNESPDARAIADLCAENKIYFLTQWNKPDDLHPWDYDPYWVAHMGVDGVPSGYYVAKALFDVMGGKGQVVAIQGMLANVPAQQRFAGLQKALAEYPDIEMVADQTANWSQSEAVGVTEAFLAAYPEMGGVWAANDNMGLGALEALKTAGKEGVIPVCGIDGTSQAIQACIDKYFAATVNNDPMWQGGMGLSLPYAAKTGVFDPSKEDHAHREFYFEPVFVNQANAQEIMDTYVNGTPTYDWTDYWGRVQGE